MRITLTLHRLKNTNKNSGVQRTLHALNAKEICWYYLLFWFLNDEQNFAYCACIAVCLISFNKEKKITKKSADMENEVKEAIT